MKITSHISPHQSGLQILDAPLFQIHYRSSERPLVRVVGLRTKEVPIAVYELTSEPEAFAKAVRAGVRAINRSQRYATSADSLHTLLRELYVATADCGASWDVVNCCSATRRSATSIASVAIPSFQEFVYAQRPLGTSFISMPRDLEEPTYAYYRKPAPMRVETRLDALSNQIVVSLHGRDTGTNPQLRPLTLKGITWAEQAPSEAQRYQELQALSDFVHNLFAYTSPVQALQILHERENRSHRSSPSWTQLSSGARFSLQQHGLVDTYEFCSDHLSTSPRYVFIAPSRDAGMSLNGRSPAQPDLPSPLFASQEISQVVHTLVHTDDSSLQWRSAQRLLDVCSGFYAIPGSIDPHKLFPNLDFGTIRLVPTITADAEGIIDTLQGVSFFQVRLPDGHQNSGRVLRIGTDRKGSLHIRYSGNNVLTMVNESLSKEVVSLYGGPDRLVAHLCAGLMDSDEHCVPKIVRTIAESPSKTYEEQFENTILELRALITREWARYAPEGDITISRRSINKDIIIVGMPSAHQFLLTLRVKASPSSHAGIIVSAEVFSRQGSRTLAPLYRCATYRFSQESEALLLPLQSKRLPPHDSQERALQQIFEAFRGLPAELNRFHESPLHRILERYSHLNTA